MLPFYSSENKFEVGVDEAGRGPLFGRLYVAAVIVPEGGFDNPAIKDSKKIKSKKKMTALAEYIKENAVAWSIEFVDHDVIDKINILQSVYQGMHTCIRECISKINVFEDKTCLLIDGNMFKPFSFFDESTDRLMTLNYETIEGGDNKYQSIAAASILAKSARDQWVEELCQEYPALSERYSMEKNMGYGTKAHLSGITEHGITQWHRKSYGPCKTALYNPVSLPSL
jgi:ribonuclease HII